GEAPAALLELLAVAGGPLAQEVLARAGGLPGDVFARHLARLRGEHLARAADDGIETYHDRVRETVLLRLDDTRRRQWHERLAVTLEESGRADPEALLVHWRGAGAAARAATHALRAAEQASAALAFERAAELYRTALELDPAQTNTPGLHARLGEALANAGRQL